LPQYTPIRADEVQPENIEWLWRDRIPKAMFTMIAGKPDQGKSMVATTIAADLTRTGHNVLYSSKERAVGIMEWPRFIAAGGVQDRMHYWRFSLPRQFDELREHVIDKQIDLVVMDPVNAHFLGVGMSTDKARTVINPLIELAEETGCAFLFIEHALKRVPAHAQPLDGIRGNSSGLPASCAMGFIFGTDPKDPDAKILCNVKHNVCECRPALRFDVDTTEIEGVENEVPLLVYRDELNFDARRLLNSLASDDPVKMGRPNDRINAASEWLTNYLARAGGPVAAKMVVEDAKHYHITGRTLRRAAQGIGVVKRPPGGGPKTTWELSEEMLATLRDSDDKGKTDALPNDESINVADEVEEWLRKLNGGDDGKS